MTEKEPKKQRKNIHYQLEVVTAEWCPHCHTAKGELRQFLHDYEKPLRRRAQRSNRDLRNRNLEDPNVWIVQSLNPDSTIQRTPEQQAAIDDYVYNELGWTGYYPTLFVSKDEEPSGIVNGKRVVGETQTVTQTRIVGWGKGTREELRVALGLPQHTLRSMRRGIKEGTQKMFHKFMNAASQERPPFITF